MNPNGLRARILNREVLSGTFIKTPAYEVMEVMKLSGLDFICIDCEHAPIDRRGMDASLAMAKALELPALVRVPEYTAGNVLMALDLRCSGCGHPACHQRPEGCRCREVRAFRAWRTRVCRIDPMGRTGWQDHASGSGHGRRNGRPCAD